MDTKNLEVPRILYRGPDDKGAIVTPRPPIAIDQVVRQAQEADRLAQDELDRNEHPTETCRVESREALEQKLKEGWRLHRTLDKDDAAAADRALENERKRAEQEAEDEAAAAEERAKVAKRDAAEAEKRAKQDAADNERRAKQDAAEAEKSSRKR